MAIPFPNISPHILELGQVKVGNIIFSSITLGSWYGLAYVIGIVGGEKYAYYLSKRYNLNISKQILAKLVGWLILGIVIGGRLGYTIIYHPDYFYDPIVILQIYKGGMSFHGGVAGVILATYCFSKIYKVPFLQITDLICMVAPIGIFLGRIGNFINGELYGRASDLPWAVIFPCGGNIPRHPSQIYEALLEGVVLFIVISYSIYWKKILNRKGLVSGIFLIGYAVCRTFAECFREPDEHIGFIAGCTMGQLLSMILLIVGAITTYFSIRASARIILNKNNSH